MSRFQTASKFSKSVYDSHTENPRNIKMSLISAIETRFNQKEKSEIPSDSRTEVNIIVGGESHKRTFIESKDVLLDLSNYFNDFFSRKYSEVPSEIFLPDIEPVIFALILRLHHESKMPITSNKKFTKIPSLKVAMAIRQACKIYSFDEIAKRMDQYIINCINTRTVFIIFDNAINNYYANIISCCKKFIQNEANFLLQTDKFLNINFELVQIISQLKLKLYSEVTLFDGLMQWSCAECKRKKLEANSKNIRYFIEPLLPNVKFLSMSEREFQEGPAQSGIFTQEEIFMILRNIKTSKISTLPNWCSKEKRIPLPYNVCTYGCNRRKFEIKQMNNMYLGFRFSVKKNSIWFCGIGICFLSQYHLLKSNQWFSIWIIVESTKDILLAYGEIISYNKDGNCKMMLINPKYLKAGDSYTVIMHAHKPLDNTPYLTCLGDDDEYKEPLDETEFVFHKIPENYKADIHSIHIHEMIFKFNKI